MSIFAMIACAGPLLSIFAGELPIGMRFGFQTFSFIPVLACVVIPSILIVRGKKKAAYWIQGYATGIALVAMSAIALLSLDLIQVDTELRPPLSASAALSSLVLIATRSTRYRLFCDFYFHLKKHKSTK